jgi:glycosyltransferase involved in cell wall biosynthesis
MAAAALESRSVGRPVVTTEVGGHVGLVARGGGRVVAPGDASALADALELELRTNRDPAELSALVTHCTPDAVAHRYLDMYARASTTPVRATIASLEGGIAR